MAGIADLQREVNRFSNDPDIGFAPIACDGIAGAQTLSATIWALTSVSLADPSLIDQTWIDSATTLIATLNTPADLTAQMPSIVNVLQNAGPLLAGNNTFCPTVVSTPNVPVVPKAIATPKAIAAQQAVQNSPAAARNFGAGILGLGLPNWAVYTGGAAIALGIIASIVHHVRMKRAA